VGEFNELRGNKLRGDERCGDELYVTKFVTSGRQDASSP